MNEQAQRMRTEARINRMTRREQLGGPGHDTDNSPEEVEAFKRHWDEQARKAFEPQANIEGAKRRSPTEHYKLKKFVEK